jgi:carbon-monoxide dehydrogenase large subunit
LSTTRAGTGQVREPTDASGPETLLGARLRRIEDPPLLTGRGRFLDDIQLPRQLEMAVLRSPHPHARILGIDTAAARASAGVVDVLTGADLVGVAGPQPIVWQPIPGQLMTEGLALAVDRVLYVGHAVAAVAAADRYAAEDALELIEVEYEPLRPVLSTEDALAPGAPLLSGAGSSNLVAEATVPFGDAASAMAAAEVVVSGRFTMARLAGCPLETRGCVATWDPLSGELDIWLSSQAPQLAAELLAEVLGVPSHKVRVRLPDIGGGFGNKFDFYGEEVIAAVLARRTDRPVKFVEDRVESFAATVHARGQTMEFEMGADADGRIVALRGTMTTPLGAELGSTGIGPGWLGALSVAGPYAIPNVEVTYRGVLTNRSPIGSYRGWGQPQANFVHERLVARLARRLGIHANEVRRRNLPSAEAFPVTSFLSVLDSGDYQACLRACERAVEQRGWPARKRDAVPGRPLGIGFGFHIEGTAVGPSRAANLMGLRHSLFDEELVRVDSTGRVVVSTGLAPMGQGIKTALAQVAAATLGVSIDEVTVLSGDTAAMPYTGYGTGGSRGASVGGGAVLRAGTRLRERILRIAGEMLEASVDDLTIVGGVVSVLGSPEHKVTLAEIGDAAYRRPQGRLPEGEPYMLKERDVLDPQASSYSYGCTAVLVEVDRATGRTWVRDYLMVHDCGTVINEMIVDGQLHGGIAQGIGQALFEELVYDDTGDLITATFMDYPIPTARDVPRAHFEHMHTPSPAIPGGMKGVGEAGVIGAPAAVLSAIEDALADLRLELDQVPMTPGRLWDAMRAVDRS